MDMIDVDWITSIMNLIFVLMKNKTLTPETLHICSELKTGYL